MLAWLNQVDAQLRSFVPAATGLLAVMVDALPWGGPGLESVATFSTLCVVYFWSLYRPDLFTTMTTFIIGLVYDALVGLPLGSTPLVLLLVRNLMVTQQRFFLARSFPVIWACFFLLVPVALVFRWLLVSLWYGFLFPIGPVMIELGLTLALYPPVSWLLGRVHSRIPRVIYAS